MWWTRGSSLPPLVSSADQVVPRTRAGVLGDPATDVLFGDETVGDSMRSGLRLSAGCWFDRCESCGLEFDFFTLETQSANFTADSPGDPILVRPFVDATTGQPAGELVAYPDVVAGGVNAAATSAGLWGWGLARRECVCCCQDRCGGGGTRTDWTIGYRHLRLDDRVTISEQLSSPLFLAGTELLVDDRFATRNSFHGLELGLERTERLRGWQLDYFAKVALGWNDASVRMRGQTTVSAPGFPPLISDGGLLVLDSNSGRHDDIDFAAVFQVGTNLRYRVTDRLGVRIGYTFLFWPDVFRAGDQIDLVMNPNLLPPPILPLNGPARPSARLHDSNFWAQGLNLGLDFQF
jgi:hypothetical protein